MLPWSDLTAVMCRPAKVRRIKAVVTNSPGNVGMIAPGLFKPEQPKDFGDRKCSRNEGFKKLFGITPIAARHDAII